MTRSQLESYLRYEFQYWRVTENIGHIDIEVPKKYFGSCEISRINEIRPAGVIFRFKSSNPIRRALFKLGLLENEKWISKL